MKGRPNIYQDSEMILKAQEIFWQKGYSATSLSDLSTATGAGTGSLYHTFKGGKKELFLKALQQRRADLKAFEARLAQSEAPIVLLKQFFVDLSREDNVAHQKGCIVANTVVEMSFVDETLKTEAIQILQETEALYKKIIAQAQKKGQLQIKTPPDVLAKYLISFWCGINSLRRIYPDPKILRTQIDLQLALLH